MLIYDKDGKERDKAWLYEKFGNVEVIYPAEGEVVYDILALVAAGDVVASRQTVVDEQGNPLTGIPVVQSWPDAPHMGPGTGYSRLGVAAPTKEDGTVDVILNEYYEPPDGGPYSVWIQGAGNSPLVNGLGLVWGSYDHLDIVWQKVGNGEPPPPEPPEPPPEPPEPPGPPPEEDDWDTLWDYLDDIIDLLQHIAGPVA